MTQTRIVARLAIRELWMTFRLLILLAAYLGGAALVALVPAPPSVVLGRLAIVLAVAGIVGAVITAWSLSQDRVRGRFGWLVTRAIRRRTILNGWFAALTLITVSGVTAAGMIGWAAAGTSGPMNPSAFGVSMISVACGAVALVTLGLALGSWLRPRLAVLATAAISAATIGVGWILLPGPILPFEALADLLRSDRPISLALQGAGASLALAVALLVAAGLVLGRADV
ncbi:MAG: hypothetical protein ACR2K4_11115 [Candidatus Limnocylindria bacterium]